MCVLRSWRPPGLNVPPSHPDQSHLLLLLHPPPIPPFTTSQRMHCKSIQVFQQRCRVEEILLRFSRFFVLPPSSQSTPAPPPPSPGLHHPPLHLKNPMKPVECWRAFQRLFFELLPSVQLLSPALGSGFQGSFFLQPLQGSCLSFYLLSSFSAPYLLIPTARPLTQNRVSQRRKVQNESSS